MLGEEGACWWEPNDTDAASLASAQAGYRAIILVCSTVMALFIICLLGPSLAGPLARLLIISLLSKFWVVSAGT